MNKTIILILYMCVCLYVYSIRYVMYTVWFRFYLFFLLKISFLLFKKKPHLIEIASMAFSKKKKIKKIREIEYNLGKYAKNGSEY